MYILCKQQFTKGTRQYSSYHIKNISSTTLSVQADPKTEQYHVFCLFRCDVDSLLVYINTLFIAYFQDAFRTRHNILIFVPKHTVLWLLLHIFVINQVAKGSYRDLVLKTKQPLNNSTDW